MAPALPLIKIGAVLFKEVSKPIAAYIKREAVQHPLLRRIAMTLGRSYEYSIQKIEKTFTNNKTMVIKPVSDTHALTVGADLVAQGFLLSTAIGLVLLEYYRNARIKTQEDLIKACQKMERQAVKKQKLLELENKIILAQEKINNLEYQIKVLSGEIIPNEQDLSIKKHTTSSWLSKWFR